MRLRDGILTRNGRDIPLSRITDVSFRKGVLDRLLGSGTLVVESAGRARRARADATSRTWSEVSALLFQLVEDKRRRVDRLGTPPDQGGP